MSYTNLFRLFYISELEKTFKEMGFDRVYSNKVAVEDDIGNRLKD